MGTLAVRFTLTVSAAAALSACGVSQPPIGAPGEMPLTHAIVERVDHVKSQSLRAAAKDAWSGDLLYVATGGDVYVLSYPSGKVVGRLGEQSATSLCSDRRGNVFVVINGLQQILEYSHRGKLLQTLAVKDIPSSCSVDPTTGNLAVPTYDYSCVYIYPGARSSGVQSICDNYFILVGLCAYDSSGNLFLDGAVGGGRHHSYVPYLAELPKGSATFNNYRLYGSRFRYDYYDSINWDGTYVTLSNPSTHSIYRVQISHKVKIVGRTRVHGWIGGFGYSVGGTQTWLKDGEFVAQWRSNPQLAIWSYPAGGQPTKVLPAFASAGTSVDGVVLSPAPH
jgi:hypothetical protein